MMGTISLSLRKKKNIGEEKYTDSQNKFDLSCETN